MEGADAVLANRVDAPRSQQKLNLRQAYVRPESPAAL